MGKRKSYRKHMKVSCQQAVLDEKGMRDACAVCGLVLRVNTVESRKTVFLHWMFNLEDGRRLMDYWPSSRTGRTRYGENYKDISSDDAFAIARDTAMRLCSDDAKSLNMGEK